MLVVSLFAPQSRKIFQFVQAAGEGSERGFLQIFKCGMQRHLLRFWKTEITKVLYPNWLSSIHYHGVIPHWKGIYTVKMSSRLSAVALLLASISIPASLSAKCQDAPGPVVQHPAPVPPDGNPWPRVIGARQ